MVHCWQQHYGERQSRRAYHNKEWAEKMISVGLRPSDTGAPGGKQTGQRVSHYILEGGPFDQLAEALLATGFRLNWQSMVVLAQDTKEKKEKRKTKFTCPSCGQNAWAKPSAQLVCGECQETMEAMV